MISKEELSIIKSECKYNDREIDLLGCFLQPEIELMMPSILVEGPPSSGKTYTLTKYLNTLRENHGILSIVIECEYCFTQREILRKIQKSLMVHYELAFTSAEKNIMVCDNLGTFPGSLKQMVEFSKLYKKKEKNRKPVIIVLDKVDRLPQFENPGELVRCLSKLHEQSNDSLSHFCFISVVTRCDTLDIGTASLPTIKFLSFEINAFKNILFLKLREEFLNLVAGWKEGYDDDLSEEEKEEEEAEEEEGEEEGEEGEAKDDKIKAMESLDVDPNEMSTFFKQFIDIILNTYSSYVGLSLDVVVPILRRIWPIFIDPVVRKGKIVRGTNDVFTTFMKNKDLLGREFAVVTKLDHSDLSLVDQRRREAMEDVETTKVSENKKGHYDLSMKTKYLVIAAFLASYNEPKYDRQFFSKGNQYNSIVKQRQKKIKTSEKGEGKLRRDMSTALPFRLERMLAILNSIWTENIGDVELFNDVELMSEIATLASLKTLIKLKNGDTIGGQTKWKCNVHWNVVKKFASDVGFVIENHLQD